GDAVGAGRVPGHADEERAVVAVVGRPPVLRRRHQLDEVLLERVDIEGLELLGVVEVLLHRVGQVRMVMEHGKVELVRPPVLVRPRPAPLGSRGGDGRALALAGAPRLFLVGHETFSSLAMPPARGLWPRSRRPSGTGQSGRSPMIGPTSYIGYNDRISR